MHLWTNCEIYLSVTFPKCANEMVLTVLFSGPISFNVVMRGKTGKNSQVLYSVDLDWTGAVGRQNEKRVLNFSIGFFLNYTDTHFTPSVTM